MGLCYDGVCHDCKERIDLDKFYSFSSWRIDAYADIEKENLDEYKNDGFIYRSLRLHFFMEQHPGHRIQVLTENNDTHDKYKEVYPWPLPGSTRSDVIDFTDPKVGRVVINTKYGFLCLDVRRDGVNVWTRLKGVGRVDTLVVPADKGTPW